MNMKSTVAPDLNPLIALEELDLKRSNLQDQLSEIPRRRGLIQAEIDKMERFLKEKEQVTAAKEKSLSAAELDLKTSQAQEGEKKAKLNTVKTQKEYDALKSEIDGSQAVRDKIEETILLLMDEIAELKSLLKKEKAASESRKKEFQQQINDLNISETNLQAEAKSLDEQARERVRELPPEMHRMYTKLRGIFAQGQIIARLVDAENIFTCSACNSPVAHQIVIEIKRAQGLYHCQYCHRLLHS